MHIYNVSESQRIADGADLLTPAKNYAVLDCLREADRPIHISEVTVTAPDESERGRQIQAVLATNLYRLWFSYPQVMGITWWNVVDGGAAQGEPSYSGLYDTNLVAKPVYYALDSLINHEWKTRLKLPAQADQPLRFRGFKGSYRVTWTDVLGVNRSGTFNLDKDGDGFAASAAGR